MAAKGRHPAGSGRPAAVLPVARRQDEVRSGADAVVSRYGLALHVCHLTLAEGSLVTRLLEGRRATRGRRAPSAQRRQRAQDGTVRLPSGGAVRQDAAVARRSRVGLRGQRSSYRGRRDLLLLHRVLVLVAVAAADPRRRGRHRRGAGRKRRHRHARARARARVRGQGAGRRRAEPVEVGRRQHRRRRRRRRRGRAAGVARAWEHIERPLSPDLLAGCFLRVVLGHAGTSAQTIREKWRYGYDTRDEIVTVSRDIGDDSFDKRNSLY